MKKSLLLLGLAALLAFSCNHDNPPAPTPEPQELALTSFKFHPASNSALSEEISCKIDGDQITGLIPSVKSGEGLIPSFTGNYAKVEVEGNEQFSGRSRQDFNDVVTYKLTDDEGKTFEYKVTVRTFTGLPIVTLTTDGYPTIFSGKFVPSDMKDTWVNGTVRIGKTPDFESDYEGAGRIRGRGNATFGYPKQPLRFKLDQKSEILEMPSDRDWVLLAEYCDQSMLRVTYVNELSKLAGMPWTSRGHHVELFINNSAGRAQYMGTYYLCEHVKAAPDRADVVDGGFLIERDGYWSGEPVKFRTNITGLPFTFKFPDSDDLVHNDDLDAPQDPFVIATKQHMDDFEAALYGDNFTDPAEGYRKYIDPENFARWMLVQEVLGNIDTNPYIARETSSSKMRMYPLWDAEWSLGLAAPGSDGWARPPAVSRVDTPYWINSDLYFGRLMQDPWFRDIVKREWAAFKNTHIPALKERVKKEADRIRYAQAENFREWPGLLGNYVSVQLVKFDTWQEEVDYAADFFQRRITWLDGEINKL